MVSRKKDSIEKKAFYTDPDYLAEGFLHQFIFDPRGKSLEGGDYTLRCWRDDFYKWDAGRYVKVSNGEMKRLVKRYLHDLNVMVQCSRRDQNQKIRITRYMVNNILLCISGMEGIHISEIVELNSWLDGREKLGIQTFVFNNGLVMIDPKKGKPVLVKHTTYYFTLSKLPFDYEPNAKCPRWLQFVSEIFQEQGNDHNENGHLLDADADKQSIATLQEFMGLFLTSETKYQKILGIVGPKRSGKGTIGKIIRELVGRESTCFPTLSSLTVEHGLQGLLNKTVAIISDASISGRGSDVIRAVERLKMISGEDGIQVNPKNKPQVDLPKLPIRFLIMSNNLQSLIDPTGALASRFVYLITTQSFYGREDFDLDKKLLSELPGIFNWSIEGLQRLSERGRFLETEAGLEAKEMAEELGSPVITFVREWCVIREGQEIKCTDFYRFYKLWTEEAGRGRLGRTKFYEEFQRAFPECNIKRERIDGPDSSPVRVFKNINVKEEHYQNHGSNYD